MYIVRKYSRDFSSEWFLIVEAPQWRWSRSREKASVFSTEREAVQYARMAPGRGKAEVVANCLAGVYS